MIKNLKIYHDSNKGKKKKLSKLKISLIGVVLTTTILSATYANYYNHKYKSYGDEIVETTNPTNTVEKNTKEDVSALVKTSDIPSGRIVDWGMGGTDISISNHAYQQFENYIDQIETSYEHEELYHLEETIKQYQDTKNKNWNRSGVNVLENKYTISSNELLEIVTQNNKKYLEEKKENKAVNTYDELSEFEVRRATELISTVVDDFLRENQNIDKTQLGYTLGNLKILTDASPNNAFITEDGCLIINLEMISVLQEMYPNEDAYKMVLTHEAIHLLQGYGASNEYQVIFDRVLSEASAEKLAANYHHTKPLTYEAMIGYTDSMNFATILNDSVELDQIESNTFTNSLDSYFEQFHCNTDKQKLEFLKMSKALNIMQLGDEDFYHNYSVVTGQEMSAEEKNQLNHRLKTNIYETITKTFYRDLARQMTSGKATIQDVFYLITLFETDINSHIKYNDEDRKQYNRDFIIKYVEIQTQFFQTMATSQTYRYEEILNMYNSYGSYITDGNTTMDNCQLNWLSPEKKKYILDKNKELEFTGTASIYESSFNYGKSK